ncbi:protocadherin-23 [Caerostris extrusa]|uniref:Protocadherin-23 n=1 Tax=Caerostris extrusa TaxID=172846 RepID=A0AAV4QYA6_CAEEX|nr:protocadherin-23 [Caerostris extrusa]
MTVIAYDQGTPSLSSTAKLSVTVADTNDAVPEFSKAVYTLEVAESRQPGDTVFKLDARKEDFKYALLNSDEIDVFDVDMSTGDMRLVKALDSVQQSHYRLLVEASVDSDPPKSDTAEVNIIVGTGHGVQLFPSRLYEVTVFENRLAPLVVLDLNAIDEIAHKPVLYSIVGHHYNGLFVMEADTGRLTVTASLDREKKGQIFLKVRAENVGRHRFGREISRSGSGILPFLYPRYCGYRPFHKGGDDASIVDIKAREVIGCIGLSIRVSISASLSIKCLGNKF